MNTTEDLAEFRVMLATMNATLAHKAARPMIVENPNIFENGRGWHGSVAAEKPAPQPKIKGIWWTPARIVQARAMALTDMSSAEIGAVMGKSARAVQAAHSRHDLGLLPPGKWTPRGREIQSALMTARNAKRMKSL